MAAAVRAGFAGRTVGAGPWGHEGGGDATARGSWLCSTQLCTRVMPPGPNPVWNEVFFFPLRVRFLLHPPQQCRGTPKRYPKKWGAPPFQHPPPCFCVFPKLPPICDEIQLAIVSG